MIDKSLRMLSKTRCNEKEEALTGGDRVSGKEDRTLIGEVIAVVLE